MKQGDFSKLAKTYIHRTGYSHAVILELSRRAHLNPTQIVTTDVGAGTGKLTEDLVTLGFKGWAIEPNGSMRSEGIRLLGNHPFLWLAGSAEATTLPDACVDLVLMGSSFHWVDPEQALKEFRRILKPEGFFIALWNPRNVEADPLQKEIEEWIYRAVPHLNRRSSGSSQYTQNIAETLTTGRFFKDPVFVEEAYTIEMSKERYLGAWQSVNDIRAQAGEETFQKILHYIAGKVADKNSLKIPYKTRAWMVQAYATGISC